MKARMLWRSLSRRWRRSASRGNDKFEHFELNSVKQAADEPVSTFSADVDTSSYSFIRKQLDQGVLPQKDAGARRGDDQLLRIFLAGGGSHASSRSSPPSWSASHPGARAASWCTSASRATSCRRISARMRNLVMLLDVSGSMDEPDKLPLVKQSMKLLLGSLKPTDTVGHRRLRGCGRHGCCHPRRWARRRRSSWRWIVLTPGGSTAGWRGYRAGLSTGGEILPQGRREPHPAVHRTATSTSASPAPASSRASWSASALRHLSFGAGIWPGELSR